MGSFDRRIAQLIDDIGDGEIVAGCTVDQPYAQIQHQNPNYEHKQGRMNYLGGPLLEQMVSLMQQLADATVTQNGSMLRNEMKLTAERMARMVFLNAPVDYAKLRTSGNPWVTDRGLKIYDRPAITPRQTGPSPTGWDRRPPKR